MHGVLLSEIFRYSAARAAKIIFLYPVIFVMAFSRSVTSFSLAALREAAKYYFCLMGQKKLKLAFLDKNYFFCQILPSRNWRVPPSP